MGKSDVQDGKPEKFSVAAPKVGTVVPKSGNAKPGVDPSAGTQAVRGQVMQERLGASYRVQASNGGAEMPNAAESGLTQRNVKNLPSAINRSGGFGEQIGDSRV